MIRYSYLHNLIGQYRALGYPEVAPELEKLAHWARPDSHDLLSDTSMAEVAATPQLRP